jgi:hypothetical protein
MMKRTTSVLLTAMVMFMAGPPSAQSVDYAIVDTAQRDCYDQARKVNAPDWGEPFYGQDAQYEGLSPSYRDNGDGTVTDLRTGLMWQKAAGDPRTWDQALSGATSFDLAGYNDWRLPTIKELYSLILFTGTDPVLNRRAEEQSLVPFLDTAHVEFRYGDAAAGERIIDAQYWSGTRYVATTMDGNKTAFGVNFADGRIKGYPVEAVGPPGRQQIKKAFVRYVRGNPQYGRNQFVDDDDGTVTDQATGLMWMKNDSGKGMDWEHALAYAENLVYAGHSDWRLPNAKELQSLVDYSRAPVATGTAAIDPVFETTPITNEAGSRDFPYFWSSTTHVSSDGSGRFAVYLAFGSACGYMRLPPWSPNLRLLDVHGAGAQRCDLKAGDPTKLPQGRGPQGDLMRILNFVRCVRDP